MSKNWYPMVDYEKCAECGTCVDKCTHGVYSKEEAPKPVVVLPEGCVEGCKGCGSLCPNDAITYFGDEPCDEEECSCSGGCGCNG